ncbi:MAG: type VI secretion system tube protein Hcp [Saprospiraceae bacterium]
MKNLLVFAFLCAANYLTAQVGIGTTTPSTNSALDVHSTSKGLMLPRLNDTTNVSNPSAGLMIYDIQTKTPAFHDGARWNTVASQSVLMSNTDSITYTISNAANGFTNGTFPLRAWSQGASNIGSSNFQDLNITKKMDINSNPFAKAVASSIVQTAMVFEVKVYAPGASTPYYSVKLTNCIISSFSLGGSTSDTFMTENISLNAVIYGYKDWTNNISFAWDDATNTVVTY